MTCFLAVSIGTVAITNEQLLALLTPEVVEPLVLAFLNDQFAEYRPLCL